MQLCCNKREQLCWAVSLHIYLYRHLNATGWQRSEGVKHFCCNPALSFPNSSLIRNQSHNAAATRSTSRRRALSGQCLHVTQLPQFTPASSQIASSVADFSHYQNFTRMSKWKFLSLEFPKICYSPSTRREPARQEWFSRTNIFTRYSQEDLWQFTLKCTRSLMLTKPKHFTYRKLPLPPFVSTEWLDVCR